MYTKRLLTSKRNTVPNAKAPAAAAGITRTALSVTAVTLSTLSAIGTSLLPGTVVCSYSWSADQGEPDEV